MVGPSLTPIQAESANTHKGAAVKSCGAERLCCISIIELNASENGLALQLTTADGKTTFDSNSDKFTDVKGFKTTAQQGLRAKDISANTNTVDKKDAQPGDMILLTAPANHVAIYSQTEPTRKLTYGNLQGNNPSEVKTTGDWSNYTRDGRGRSIKYNPDTKHAHRWKVLSSTQPQPPQNPQQ